MRLLEVMLVLLLVIFSMFDIEVSACSKKKVKIRDCIGYYNEGLCQEMCVRKYKDEKYRDASYCNKQKLCICKIKEEEVEEE